MNRITYNIFLGTVHVGTAVVRYGNYIEQVILNNNHPAVAQRIFAGALELIYTHAGEIVNNKPPKEAKFPNEKYSIQIA